MAKTVPVREFRADLAEFLDEVADLREHVIVTRNGRPAAVLVPIDEYDALEETAEILSDREAMDAIRKGRAELKAGKTVTLGALRKELKKRRA
ncbi:MAG: type II toxin-antitoxin system Phd/YefM family antitoxin [Actinomycetota bacterium]